MDKKKEAPHKSAQKKRSDTSWEPVGKWYHGIVGESGHYYHQSLVIPGVLNLFGGKDDQQSILDLACGQGILGRHLPLVEYEGIDISPTLIKAAIELDKAPRHRYTVADITKPLNLRKMDFSHAAVILALQNVEHPGLVLKNAHKHLRQQGKLILVINHPCFRIPRQSSWKIDEEKKIQYRRIDKYYSPMKIPIHANPSKGEKSVHTWSFHHPLSDYSKWLNENGFVIDLIEEWLSDKVSTGSAAKMENRCREEFPMFMAIRAIKR